MAAKQQAGPGKKQCPKCQRYVGVRTLACECGHAFSVPANGKPTANKKAVLDPTQQVIRTINLLGTVKSFVDDHGGFQTAQAVIVKVNDLADQAGGKDNLLAILKAIEASQPKLIVVESGPGINGQPPVVPPPDVTVPTPHIAPVVATPPPAVVPPPPNKKHKKGATVEAPAVATPQEPPAVTEPSAAAKETAAA